MCNNIVFLYFMIIIKIVFIIILPLIIIFKRKEKISKKLLIIDVVGLLFLVICNGFTINKCVYNSSINGLKKIKNENIINLFNDIHSMDHKYVTTISPDKRNKTYKGRDLYYYNQNNEVLKNYYANCGDEKVYFNAIGSSITSFSTAVSTLYNKNISPIKIFNRYKRNYFNICSSEITIEKLYNNFIQEYSGILLEEISVNEVKDSIINDGLVIVKLQANENSTLTCDTKYIVIYSVNMDNKYLISDSSLLSGSYVCPSNSKAYGNVIKNDIMKKQWSLDDINKEAVKYYLIKKVS